MEFTKVGEFTLAMNAARQKLLKENPSSTKRRKTRGQAKKKEVPVAAKGRRRIVFNDDSS
jgi:hypothetical protein